MKRIILTLFFILSLVSLNNISIGNAESKTENSKSNEFLADKLNKLEKKVYVDNLIQRIEFESELIIPENIDIKYVEYTYNLTKQLKLSTRTVFRLMYMESTFIDTLVSTKGATGLMQLMSGTRSDYYKLLRVDTLKLDKNQEDIYIGLNYLNDLHAYWISKGNSEKYSWKLALASYNAGYGNVLKYKGIPPYKETIDFVDFISKSHSNPDFFKNYIKKYENTTKVSS